MYCTLRGTSGQARGAIGVSLFGTCFLTKSAYFYVAVGKRLGTAAAFRFVMLAVASLGHLCAVIAPYC